MEDKSVRSRKSIESSGTSSKIRYCESRIQTRSIFKSGVVRDVLLAVFRYYAHRGPEPSAKNGQIQLTL